MKTFLNYSIILVWIVFFFMTQFTFGQKPTIGIKTGVVFSNATINSTNPGSYFKISGKTSVLAGVYLNVPSGEKLIFRPGSEIVSKGVTNQFDVTYSYRYPIIFTYLDFPVNILYKINYTNSYILAGGGPVIGIPISNQYEFPLKSEFSINGLLGYELAIGFSLNMNYTYGLSNASRDKQNTSKISNRYLGITVGYTF